MDCRKPASLKGIKARVSPAPSSRVFWRQVGAAGAQMSLADLFPALQQGVVEAADLPFVYYVTTPRGAEQPGLCRHDAPAPPWLVHREQGGV